MSNFQHKINFPQERWENIKNNYRLWWDRQIDRPLIFATKKVPSPPPFCGTPCDTSQIGFGNTDISPKQLAENIVYNLSITEFLGDSYPLFNFAASGPGIIAAYLGGELSLNEEGRIWFHPMNDRPEISNLHFEFDKENFWYKRTVEIIRNLKELSDGNMVVSFPDFGGIMDVLSTFFPSEELFFEMADNEEDVKRLLVELEHLWFEIYDNLYEELSGFKGYTSWCYVYSDRKTYIHQCDFSYMIGPDDFDEFVLPSLKKEFIFSQDPLYHLDGKGELIHLPKILECENLKAVQWVPGDGNNPPHEWPEVLEQIFGANMNTHLPANFDSIMQIKKNHGTARKVFAIYSLGENENLEESLKLFAD